MKPTRTFLRTMLLWGMLPLTVLAGSPRPLCLCSNGDVKLFCQGAAAPHTCCPTTSGNSAKSHCRSGCCGAVKQERASDTAIAPTSCHCTRFVALPDATPKAADVHLPDLDVDCNAPVDWALTPATVAATPLVLIEASPPPLAGRDALVALGHWLV